MEENIKKLRYCIEPTDQQKLMLDDNIRDFMQSRNSDRNYYEYDIDSSLRELITSTEGQQYIHIKDVGKVKIMFSDFPEGICTKIIIKKENLTYFVTFICYKKIVGIDLGEREIICSSGDKFQLPYIWGNKKKFSDIKKEWLGSVAVQLLLDYDVLFLENLEVDQSTPFGFREILAFKDILQEKAELFEKEVYILKEKKYPSTQICHICGGRNRELKNAPTKRVWICPYCGTKHDRDINAAINVMRKGMEEYHIRREEAYDETPKQIESINLSTVKFEDEEAYDETPKPINPIKLNTVEFDGPFAGIRKYFSGGKEKHEAVRQQDYHAAGQEKDH